MFLSRWGNQMIRCLVWNLTFHCLVHISSNCSVSDDLLHTLFLGAFAKFRKATVSFVMPVRYSVRMETFGSHWMDFHEIWYFRVFENLSRKFTFNWNLRRITSTLHEDGCTFMIVCCWNFRRTVDRNFRTGSKLAFSEFCLALLYWILFIFRCISQNRTNFLSTNYLILYMMTFCFGDFFADKFLSKFFSIRNKRSSPFWDVTQLIIVVSYGRFGTTYRPHLQDSSSLLCLTLENGADRLSRNVSS
jgi:hypothetical protein